MKLLITGANGQLGCSVIKALKTEKAEICAFGKQDLDICDFNAAEKNINREKPDIIINCAAYTNVDGCENDEDSAYKVNALGVENLVRCAKKIDAKLVHISTDFVFDGKTATPYKESDKTAPLNIYGKSKLEGEKFALKYKKGFVLRTAWLYANSHKNFVSTIKTLSRERDEISVVTDQIGCPTFTDDLADCILKLMATENYGLYHCANSGFCSKFELTEEIVKLSGHKCKVTPCLSNKFPSPAKRPSFSALDCSKIENTVGNMRDWKTALKDYFEKEKP